MKQCIIIILVDTQKKHVQKTQWKVNLSNCLDYIETISSYNLPIDLFAI